MNHIYLLFRKTWQRYHLSRYRRIVRRANEMEPSFLRLCDADLDARREELQSRAQTLSDILPLLPEALALGRELSQRRLEMRHYDVQLMGALALYEGYIAEMDTGEGKTLMAPLAAFLHQLGRHDCCTHIVTANEYLAARDAQWMAPFCEGLGLSVGLIVPGQAVAARAAAYQNDIVYATAREVVFDSLREPIRQKRTSTADAILRPQRELNLDPKYDYAIVDEVDSVLIDQARSPLSVGGQSNVSARIELYRKAYEIAGQLVRGRHYRLLYDDRSVEMKEEGQAEARRQAGGVLQLLPPGHKWQRYVTCALAARYIYKCDQHYVVRDGKIVLIDESTGRLLPSRQLPDGIHQAIEVQNRITPSAELRGNYTTTFQTFFRKYKKLAGMTGTASISAWEFSKVYNLSVLPIPSNKPSQRNLLPDRIYRNRKSKYHAMIEEILQVHAAGRPILIGTGSVQISEQISEMLRQKNLPHEILNAKNHAREAEIIAQAGGAGRITVITNMAGRGVDIKLAPGVAQNGGMHLISTDRLAFRRLDLQLTGRVGRQGDPADCQFYLSLRDELMRYADKKKICRIRIRTRNRRSEPIDLHTAEALFDKVQKHIDKLATRQRHAIFRGEQHREKLKAQGLWEDWMDIR